MTPRDSHKPSTDEQVSEPAEPAVLALAEAAEAEAEAAEAQASAAAARVRAIRLRREAAVTQPDCQNADDKTRDEADQDSAGSAIDAAAGSVDGAAVTRRWSGHRLTRRALTVGATILVTFASLAISGQMAWHHHDVSLERQRAAEFAAAARQAAVTLMSLDPAKSKQDIQRIADMSTGGFKDRFPMIAAQLTNGLQQSKLVTTVTVDEVAVETMSDNSAIVLVAATTHGKKPDGGDEPGFWHIALGLTKDAGQPKISNVEFVQ